LAADGEQNIASLIRAALIITLGCGFLTGTLWALACGPLVHHVFRIPVKLQQETLQAFYLLCVALPAMSCAEGLRGALGAFQRFDLINAVRAPADIISSLGLLAVLPFSRSLAVLTGVLVLGRLIQCLGMLLACVVTVPDVRKSLKVEWCAIAEMARFGGWLTMSRVTNPLLNNLDQFLVAALLPAKILAFYTTPCELASRLWYLPTFVDDVWFAALSLSFAQRAGKVAALTTQLARIIFLLMFPPAVLLLLYAPEVLGLWLGPIFALHSAFIMQLVALAVLIGAFRTVPATLMLAANRPDAGTKFRLIELPLYAALSWLLVKLWGIEGAAVARLAREAAEAVVYTLLARRIVPEIANDHQSMWILTGSAAAGLTMTIVPATLVVRVPLSILVLATIVLLGWFYFLEADDRQLMKVRLNLASAGRARL
jgi:O-antigen/teichoic acid export membrane protein